jgi:DNA ligase-1
MDELALVCEDIARVAGKLKKIHRLADYLRGLDDSDLRLAVQFLSGGPAARAGTVGTNHTLFATEEKTKLSVPRRAIRDALQLATGWDSEIMRVCFSETGDSGETAGLLLRGCSTEEPMSLRQADELYQDIIKAGNTGRKRDLLAAVYRRHKPLTIKYFVKVMTRGLRIGLLERMLEEAVAVASGVPQEQVREANNRLGDLPEVALAARHGELAGIETRLFHPMDFMLAKPLERLEDLADPSDWFIEDKFDGIRSQIHFDNGVVRIYSRGMEDVTAAFPEITLACQQLRGTGVLDGELLAWRDERALNFNVLQQRIARKSVRATLLKEVPVVFMGYDALLLRVPFEQRRTALEAVLENISPLLRVSTRYAAATHQEVDQLFLAARARGNEGLLLKRRGSLYEPGKRTGAWQKLKRHYGTLDVVITAAEQGHGRRAIYFSDYTFAVRTENGYVNVGKAYSGLTDAEVKDLTRILRSASTEKFGSVMLVKPEVVLEVAFDGVQKSSRHKSGYALRFPRILRWRKDKRAEEADDLTRVESLYRGSLAPAIPSG